MDQVDKITGDCPLCGEVQLDPTQIQIRNTPEIVDTVIAFRCPVCENVHTFLDKQNIAIQLIDSGVKVVPWLKVEDNHDQCSIVSDEDSERLRKLFGDHRKSWFEDLHDLPPEQEGGSAKHPNSFNLSCGNPKGCCGGEVLIGDIQIQICVNNPWIEIVYPCSMCGFRNSRHICDPDREIYHYEGVRIMEWTLPQEMYEVHRLDEVRQAERESFYALMAGPQEVWFEPLYARFQRDR